MLFWVPALTRSTCLHRRRLQCPSLAKESAVVPNEPHFVWLEVIHEGWLAIAPKQQRGLRHQQREYFYTGNVVLNAACWTPSYNFAVAARFYLLMSSDANMLYLHSVVLSVGWTVSKNEKVSCLAYHKLLGQGTFERLVTYLTKSHYSASPRDTQYLNGYRNLLLPKVFTISGPCIYLTFLKEKGAFFWLIVLEVLFYIM